MAIIPIIPKILDLFLSKIDQSHYSKGLSISLFPLNKSIRMAIIPIIPKILDLFLSILDFLPINNKLNVNHVNNKITKMLSLVRCAKGGISLILHS